MYDMLCCITHMYQPKIVSQVIGLVKQVTNKRGVQFYTFKMQIFSRQV